LAYTLVDVDSPIPGAMVEQIRSIEGVLSTRMIPARNGNGAR
jgi:hypothetical protein